MKVGKLKEILEKIPQNSDVKIQEGEKLKEINYCELNLIIKMNQGKEE